MVAPCAILLKRLEEWVLLLFFFFHFSVDEAT